MDLKELDILGPDVGSHWYYQAKARAVQRLLGTRAHTRVLDIGAGSGFFSKFLLEHTPLSEACCVDISYEQESQALHAGKPVHYLKHIDSYPADLVLLMDVLEHVDDDVGLLADYVAKVPVGSTFLITVPAFQFMWSGHDDFLEHKRRYSLGQLEQTVRGGGLTVRRSAYYYGAVFPLAAVSRLAGRWLAPRDQAPRSQLRRHGPLSNAILGGLCRIELPLMPFNRLGGLSAICLASKSS